MIGLAFILFWGSSSNYHFYSNQLEVTSNQITLIRCPCSLRGHCEKWKTKSDTVQSIDRPHWSHFRPFPLITSVSLNFTLTTKRLDQLFVLACCWSFCQHTTFPIAHLVVSYIYVLSKWEKKKGRGKTENSLFLTLFFSSISLLFSHLTDIQLFQKYYDWLPPLHIIS